MIAVDADSAIRSLGQLNETMVADPGSVATAGASGAGDGIISAF